MKASVSRFALVRKLRGFAKDRQGVASIEGAFVMTMLAGLFVGIADLGSSAYISSRLSSGLRFSAQYLMTTDKGNLTVAEQVFRDTYTDGNATFSSAFSCTCAEYRSDLDAAAANGGMQLTREDLGTVTQDSPWPQCTFNCGTGEPIRYLRLEATAKVRSLINASQTQISDEIVVRVE